MNDRWEAVSSAFGRRPPPAPGVPRPEAPTFTFFAAYLGGVLILLQGLAVLAGGGASVEFGVVSTALGLAQVGGAGVALGIGIIAVGFALQENPERRGGVGVAMVLFGLLSLVSGGGFLVGMALAVVGGLLTLLMRPATV